MKTPVGILLFAFLMFIFFQNFSVPQLSMQSIDSSAYRENSTGALYVEGGNGNLHRIIWSPSTGWTDWDMGYAVHGTPIQENSTGALYVEGGNGNLHRIIWSQSTGWTDWDMGYAVHGTPMLDQSTGALYVEGGNGNLHRIIWSQSKGWSNTDLKISMVGAPLKDVMTGNYFVEGRNGNLHRLNESSNGKWTDVDMKIPLARSKYIERLQQTRSLATDLTVDKASKSILRIKMENKTSQDKYVFIQSDGRFYPKATATMANMVLAVDGKSVSSGVVIDWKESRHPMQHSFNIVGTARLTPGTHLIELIGNNLYARGSYVVGQTTNLSVLESTAQRLQIKALDHDFGPTNASTWTTDYNDQASVLPINSFLKFDQNPLGRSAFFMSGRIYLADMNRTGDAMVGISMNGKCPSVKQQSWSVNDTFLGAELQSPVYSHAINLGPSLAQSPVAFASVFPWIAQKTVDPVSFYVGSGTVLMSLENPDILGAGYAKNIWSEQCNSVISTCVANTNECPGAGKKVIVAETNAYIPTHSDGVLMIVAKLRVQPTMNDPGAGNVYMGLMVDGKDVGSIAVQGISPGASDSQRTMSASHLFDVAHALKHGNHKIQVWMKADPSFQLPVSTFLDMPILFFN